MISSTYSAATRRSSGLRLGGVYHLRASRARDAHDLLLLYHRLGLLLCALAHCLGLALGVADELIARGNKALRLRQRAGQVRLYLVDDVDRLLALDNALVIAEGTPQASVTMP